MHVPLHLLIMKSRHVVALARWLLQEAQMILGVDQNAPWGEVVKVRAGMGALPLTGHEANTLRFA
jgi:hypothetical protein